MEDVVEIVRKKALKSICNTRVGAVGISDDGRVILSTFNRPRFYHPGGGTHAEMDIMRRCGKNLKSILICRVNPKGKILPLHPCSVCKAKADELGIKIYSAFEV